MLQRPAQRSGDITTLEAEHTGRCLCGGVRYRVTGELRGIIACHCAQCRRTSGHHVAATSAPSANNALTASTSLGWYRSSGDSDYYVLTDDLPKSDGE